MAISHLLYRILYILVTSFYNFSIMVCGIADRLRLVWTLPNSRLGESYGDTLLLKNTGLELEKQKKLPRHVACLFTDETMDVHSVVSIVQWCALTGISCISLFDHNGFIVRSRETIESLLQTSQNAEATALAKKDYVFHSSTSSCDPIEIGCNQIHIFFLSRNHGRPEFAKVAREIATKHSHQEITLDTLEKEMYSSYLPEAELMLQFGSQSAHLSLGYPPWQLRLTEMLRVPCHSSIQPQHIASALRVYGRCEQRYGK